MSMAIDLSGLGLDTIEEDKNDFKYLYDEALPIKDKVKVIATEIYRAGKVAYSPKATKEIKKLTELGFDKMPICIAKTQYSLSDDPTLLGAPKDFEITVKNLTLSNGAGFVVVVTGAIMTMPGLPKVPAANNIDVNADGVITGLF